MSEPKALYVLAAPANQLSGDGQLRESIKERKDRKGDDYPIWYLSPSLVEEFKISNGGIEAVVAEDKKAINWLKLRFGGESSLKEFDTDELNQKAKELPPSPINKDIRHLQD